MSVIVKGMEKPEHCGFCRFRYDGICHALQRTLYSMADCPLLDVIRCENCKHWDDDWHENSWKNQPDEPIRNFCYIHEHYTEANFFCADGYGKEE